METILSKHMVYKTNHILGEHMIGSKAIPTAWGRMLCPPYLIIYLLKIIFHQEAGFLLFHQYSGQGGRVASG